MRPKELRIVVTFETTTAAMAFENEAEKRKVLGRLIPVPREITAGCGLSFSAPIEAKEQIRELTEQLTYRSNIRTGNIKRSRQVILNCSPSRGQRKNIKFSRPAAKCCRPLFMQQGTTCVFLSASVRPSYAGLFWCCNNGCSTQSFARVPVCW